MAVEFNGAAASHAFARGNLFGNIFEESWTGMGIGIDKNEPVAGRDRSAAVSSAGDLVDGFEDDFGSGGAGDFSGFVGGIIVADDEFGFPAAFVEGSESGADVAKGFAKTPFFVEGRDDGGDFQTRIVESLNR